MQVPLATGSLMEAFVVVFQMHDPEGERLEQIMDVPKDTDLGSVIEISEVCEAEVTDTDLNRDPPRLTVYVDDAEFRDLKRPSSFFFCSRKCAMNPTERGMMKSALKNSASMSSESSSSVIFSFSFNMSRRSAAITPSTLSIKLPFLPVVTSSTARAKS